MFEEILGLEIPKEFLSNALKSGRLPSACLFLGKKGIGKTSMALALAKEINKMSAGAKEKNSQGLFELGEHPDFLVVKKEGHFIRISQIKALFEVINQAPLFSSTRVILVKSAEDMNDEAANAFLKMLEEPPEGNLFILTSTEQSLLPETICSRCERIFFPHLNKKDLKRIYGENFEIEHKYHDFLLAHSYGCVRKDWIDKPKELYEVREQALSMLTDLNEASMPDHFSLIEKIAAKDYHMEWIEFAASWMRDAMMIKTGSKVKHINTDRLEELLDFADNWSFESINFALRAILEAENSLHFFIAKQLALEGILLALRRIKKGAFYY